MTREKRTDTGGRLPVYHVASYHRPMPTGALPARVGLLTRLMLAMVRWFKLSPSVACTAGEILDGKSHAERRRLVRINQALAQAVEPIDPLAQAEAVLNDGQVWLAIGLLVDGDALERAQVRPTVFASAMRFAEAAYACRLAGYAHLGQSLNRIDQLLGTMAHRTTVTINDLHLIGRMADCAEDELAGCGRDPVYW